MERHGDLFLELHKLAALLDERVPNIETDLASKPKEHSNCDVLIEQLTSDLLALKNNVTKLKTDTISSFENFSEFTNFGKLVMKETKAKFEKSQEYLSQYGYVPLEERSLMTETKTSESEVPSVSNEDGQSNINDFRKFETLDQLLQNQPSLSEETLQMLNFNKGTVGFSEHPKSKNEESDNCKTEFSSSIAKFEELEFSESTKQPFLGRKFETLDKLLLNQPSLSEETLQLLNTNEKTFKHSELSQSKNEEKPYDNCHSETSSNIAKFKELELSESTKQLLGSHSETSSNIAKFEDLELSESTKQLLLGNKIQQPFESNKIEDFEISEEMKELVFPKQIPSSLNVSGLTCTPGVFDKTIPDHTPKHFFDKGSMVWKMSENKTGNQSATFKRDNRVTIPNNNSSMKSLPLPDQKILNKEKLIDSDDDKENTPQDKLNLDSLKMEEYLALPEYYQKRFSYSSINEVITVINTILEERERNGQDYRINATDLTPDLKTLDVSARSLFMLLVLCKRLVKCTGDSDFFKPLFQQ